MPRHTLRLMFSMLIFRHADAAMLADIHCEEDIRLRASLISRRLRLRLPLVTPLTLLPRHETLILRHAPCAICCLPLFAMEIRYFSIAIQMP